MYLLLGLPLLFSQNSSVFFLKKSSINCCTFDKSTKKILIDGFGVRFVSHFRRKSDLFVPAFILNEPILNLDKPTFKDKSCFLGFVKKFN